MRRPGKEYRRDLKYIHNATLIFKKDIFKKVKFTDTFNNGDNQLVQDCIDKKLKVFSTDRHNYVYIRNDISKHNYKIKEEKLLRGSNVITKTDDFLSYITQ